MKFRIFIELIYINYVDCYKVLLYIEYIQKKNVKILIWQLYICIIKNNEY